MHDFAKPVSDLLTEIPNSSQPTGGQGVALTPRGRVPSSALPRTITGLVNSGGTIAAGTGFSVVHSATGHYAVTFTGAFPSTPAIIVSVVNNGLTVSCDVISPTATGFTMETYTISPLALSDAGFHFIAREIA